MVLAVFFAVQWWQTRDAPHGMAPALRGPLLEGGGVDLHALRGQPVLVHFWAVWCPICRLEQDNIAGLARDYRVITVATTSGDAAEVRRYLQEQGLAFPTLLDEDGSLGRRWGVKGVPASFVIGPDGQVAYATMGYSTGLGLRLRLWLAGR